MGLTMGEVAKEFTIYEGNIQTSLSIDFVHTDSRLEKPNSLFIPIIGETFDGHHFIMQAIENGAIAAFWQKDKKRPKDLPKDFPIFLVENTISALQHLAKYYRQKVNPIVVAITGSNGKTTTKDIVFSIIKTTYKTHATKGNLNNHIGLPLTILEMKQDTEILVLEMGMNDFGEIDLLTNIAQPDYAMITNIGESHIEFLKSREGIAKAKLEIVNGLKKEGFLLFNGDEPLLLSQTEVKNTLLCGFKEHNDFQISDINISRTKTTFSINHEGNYSLPLLGKHHALNATLGIALSKQLNISEQKIQEGLSTLKVSSMRFEWLKGENNVTIINDAYNASPTSMKASIEVVKELKGFDKKILILGDIFELGKFSRTFHQSIASVIQPPITKVLTIGEEMEYLHKHLKREDSFLKCYHFYSTEKLIQFLKSHLHKKTLLFFKASRGMHFEKIVEALL